MFAFVSACAQPPTFSSDDSVVPGSIGVTVRQQRTAVIVTGVKKNGPAAAAGVRVGTS